MSNKLVESESSSITDAIINNPWRNAYWFARMLINDDKYGAIGKANKLIVEICTALRLILDDPSHTHEEKVNLSKEAIKKLIDIRFAKKSAKTDRIQLFVNDISDRLLTLDDISVFILTAESIIIPINNALGNIPNDDKVFTQIMAQTYLDSLGEGALATVINRWDDAGVEGSLNAERAVVVSGFAHLRRDIVDMPELESNLILTAYMQEFERRLGQKRKGRGGRSLEDVTSFLLDYFKIKATHAPDHFQADIEVDKWVRASDRWLIGISCKRTLRERWKQVTSADRGVMGRYKIKQIWHIVTYDEDLSDEKLALMGGLDHRFYLRDESRRYKAAAAHLGLQQYVRPMSRFISDLRQEVSS